jgi:sugar phosphate isomerase/epimerase
MRKVGDTAVFELAARIPGLLGVELQVVSGNHDLWSKDTLRRYKREANRWGMRVPSLSGPFGRGVTLKSPGAGEQIQHAIRAAEFLGSSVILIPSFRDNCPDMAQETSWGPVVRMLQTVAPIARDAGVTLGLENSLDPAGNVKLCDLVNHPSVRIYYDLDNCEFYGHEGQAVPGVKIMGKDRICQVHVKNEERLIEEPGRVDWKAALSALRDIRYEGWYVFESRHTSDQQCIESTTRNIAFFRSISSPLV